MHKVLPVESYNDIAQFRPFGQANFSSTLLDGKKVYISRPIGKGLSELTTESPASSNSSCAAPDARSMLLVSKCSTLVQGQGMVNSHASSQEESVIWLDEASTVLSSKVRGHRAELISLVSQYSNGSLGISADDNQLCLLQQHTTIMRFAQDAHDEGSFGASSTLNFL